MWGAAWNRQVKNILNAIAGAVSLLAAGRSPPPTDLSASCDNMSIDVMILGGKRSERLLSISVILHVAELHDKMGHWVWEFLPYRFSAN